jgi:hypothetical protein
VRHCAHPSLPLDHPGVGPSEAESARCAALAAAEAAAAAAAEDQTSRDEEGEVVLAAGGDSGSEFEDAPASPGRQGGSAQADGDQVTPVAAPALLEFHPDSEGGPARPAHVVMIARRKVGAAASDEGGALDSQTSAETATTTVRFPSS